MAHLPLIPSISDINITTETKRMGMLLQGEEPVKLFKPGLKSIYLGHDVKRLKPVPAIEGDIGLYAVHGK